MFIHNICFSNKFDPFCKIRVKYMQWLMLWPLHVLGSKQGWTWYVFVKCTAVLVQFSTYRMVWEYWEYEWFQKYERADLTEGEQEGMDK